MTDARWRLQVDAWSFGEHSVRLTNLVWN